MSSTDLDTETKVIRADCWLWAARMFKTRVLAKAAIENGKVHYNGSKFKSNQELNIGDVLTVFRGNEVKELTVVALSKKRSCPEESQKLYKESANSRSKHMSQLATRPEQFQNSNPKEIIRYLKEKARKMSQEEALRNRE